ncbi:MAG: hypothetical protein E6Q97_06485 [Desulfurellales bacterium]|nr:MAG: hypothetical protein E6Q97_06485 [Desulfurellales bacterium]
MTPRSIRERILGATKRRYRKSRIVVDGEVIEVGLRSLTEEERTAFEMVQSTAKSERDAELAKASYRRRLIVLMTVELDENGNWTEKLLFEPTDVIDLEAVDCGITCTLFNDAMAHAYLSSEDIEELAKNSVATAGDS